MSRSPWKRITAASLIALVCLLAIPATSQATAASWRSGDTSVTRLWSKIVDWLQGVWPGAGVRAPANDKFGAGHSSDGRVYGRIGRAS